MISLVETGLMNALLAVCLALPVLILGRLWQRPALIHAFWILVLIKLVSPPLYHVPVSWQMPTWYSVETAAVLPPASSAVVTNSHDLVNSPPYSVLSKPASAWESAMGHVAANWWQWMGAGWNFLQSLIVPALYVWLIGSICWFSWQGWRVVRFAQVFLRSAQIAPDTLQQQAQVLAQQMGMKRCPTVWLLPHVVSPMLWSVGGKPRILFPRELLSRMDDCAVATLLTHELAHFRRGDHRVRMLEFLASGLFWWHPIVWVARRELEIAEEQCCDAWVVSQFPASQRRYADALLATVDFLSEDHPPLPILASGLGDVPMLRQRLKLIMCGTAPKSLSAVGRLAVILTAMLIPISPSLRATVKEVPDVAPPTTTPVPPDAPIAAVHQRNRDLGHAHATRPKQDIDAHSQIVEASRLPRNALVQPIAASISEDASPVDDHSRDAVRDHSSINSPNSARGGHRVWAKAAAPNGLNQARL